MTDMWSGRWLRAALVAGGLCLPAAAAGQVLRGVVLDDGDRTPIAGVSLELSRERGEPERAESDSLGAFQYRGLAAGRYVLALSHPAYHPLASDTFTVAAGETVTLELRLAPAAIALEPLVVTARARDQFGGFYERAAGPGFGRFLTRAELERRSAGRVTDLLQGVPGVYLATAGGAALGGSGVRLVTMRGTASGRCLPVVYIDGMPFRQLPESGVDQFLTPGTIEGIEIYTSAATVPAQLASLNSCGVVAFWTRDEGRRPFSWRRLALGLAAFGLLVLLFR